MQAPNLIPKRKVPLICKTQFCKPCRQLCYASSKKPRKACVEIFCPSYLSAKKEATRFKISWSVISEGERTTQIIIFLMLLSYLILFALISFFVPFTAFEAITTDNGGCHGKASFAVYGAYGGIFVLGVAFETYIQMILVKLFKDGQHTKSIPSCNRFVLSAWL